MPYNIQVLYSCLNSLSRSGTHKPPPHIERTAKHLYFSTRYKPVDVYLYNLLCITVCKCVSMADRRQRRLWWRILCGRNVNRQTFNFMSVCKAASHLNVPRMGDAWENRKAPLMPYHTSTLHPSPWLYPDFALRMGMGQQGKMLGWVPSDVMVHRRGEKQLEICILIHLLVRYVEFNAKR